MVKSGELLQGDSCDLPVIKDSNNLEEIKTKEEIKTCLFPNINDAIKYVKSFSASFTGSISSNDRTQYEYSINGGTVVLIYKEHDEPNYRVHVNSQDAIAKVTEVKNELTFGEVREVVKSGELLQGDCDLPEEEEIKIQPLTFKEIKALAIKAGYELEPLLGMFRLIKNNKILTFSNLKRCKDFLTLPEEEEIKLTKESDAALKLLVKYDFTMRELTQFEQFSLESLKKYVESGIKPKLIKTFAETLLRKLSPEERVGLRDRALGKVFIRN
jgi:hypothetical protein